MWSSILACNTQSKINQAAARNWKTPKLGHKVTWGLPCLLPESESQSYGVSGRRHSLTLRTDGLAHLVLSAVWWPNHTDQCKRNSCGSMSVSLGTFLGFDILLVLHLIMKTCWAHCQCVPVFQWLKMTHWTLTDCRSFLRKHALITHSPVMCEWKWNEPRWTHLLSWQRHRQLLLCQFQL